MGQRNNFFGPWKKISWKLPTWKIWKWTCKQIFWVGTLELLTEDRFCQSWNTFGGKGRGCICVQEVIDEELTTCFKHLYFRVFASPRPRLKVSTVSFLLGTKKYLFNLFSRGHENIKVISYSILDNLQSDQVLNELLTHQFCWWHGFHVSFSNLGDLLFGLVRDNSCTSLTSRQHPIRYLGTTQNWIKFHEVLKFSELVLRIHYS